MTVFSDFVVSRTIRLNEVPVTVPNVVGESLADAITVLQNAELVVGAVTYISSAIAPAGTVINQDPTAGSNAPVGSQVNLEVSGGATGDIDHNGRNDAVDVQLVINAALGITKST